MSRHDSTNASDCRVSPPSTLPSKRPTKPVLLFVRHPRFAEEKTSIYTFAYSPGKRGGASRSAHVTYSIFRDGVELHKLKQPDPTDLTKSYENGFPMAARLPMGKLPPGDYRIRILIEDPGLGRRATGEILLAVR